LPGVIRETADRHPEAARIELWFMDKARADRCRCCSTPLGVDLAEHEVEAARHCDVERRRDTISGLDSGYSRRRRRPDQ
jgi:hypothetical protein